MKLCPHEARDVVVPLARYLSSEGRSDVVATFRNDTPRAEARGVVYRIDVYTEAGERFATTRGELSIPGQSTRAVFAEGISSIAPSRAQAFVTIESVEGFYRERETQSSLRVHSPQFFAHESSPRLIAEATGDEEKTLLRVPVVAIVFSADGRVLAASRTIIPALRAGGQETIVFTWNEPFDSIPARAEFFPEL